tara:strand:- start:1451 stop:2134 length:684 start_codon:yes stop_codon:yes gene_type:complete
MSPDNEAILRHGNVCEAIKNAARDAGRLTNSVALCAVSKTFPPEAIAPVIEGGQEVFGENRVQEAEGKWLELKANYPQIKLHLIGPLQTNKTRSAVALFDVIQTLDRPKLGQSLAKEMERADRRLPCYIQINTGEEPQKAGIFPKDADLFIRTCRESYQLDIAGLMCIPPQNEEASPHFALLADIGMRNGLTGLSMGMSADYQLAIEFGATIVRVGSAIFGARRQAV